MKRALHLCAALCLTNLSAASFAAKPVILQTVDLNDKNMSAQGGEAKLYRITTAKGSYCRIEAIHYGETGKALYGFAFNRRLFSAVRREYHYDPADFTAPNLKIELADTQTLETKKGSATLPTAFKEYRSFFDPRQLARCSRR
jgi:hypothetical protein